MKENCGIIALDALVKSLNLNMNRISLDTLSKICRDNGRLMFPLRIPKEKLAGLDCPYVLQTNNHFEMVEDETALDVSDVGDQAYLLYPILNAHTIPYVIDEEEAKKVIGACSGGVKNIPIIGPYISKPARAVPLAVSAVGQMLGIPAPLTMAMSTAAGLGQAGTTGIWGEPGSGSSLLTGGLQGFGQGMVGRGLGSGLSNVFDLKTAAGTNPTGAGGFLSGFKEGFGQSIPFGQTLGLYSPTAAKATGPLTSAFNQNQGNAFSFLSPTSQVAEGYPKWAGGLDTSMFGGGGGGQPPTGFGGISPIEQPAQAATNAIQGAVSEATKKAFDLKSYLPSAALFLGSQLTQSPEYNVPSAADTYRQLMQSNAISTPERVALMNEVMKNVTNPESIYGANTDAMKAAIQQQYALRRERAASDFASRWAAQYGDTTGSDFYRMQNEYLRQMDAEEQAALAAVDMEVYKTRVNIYSDSIAKAYGLDQANVQDLIGLTNMTISEAATRYGIKAKEVSDLRNAMYQLAISSWPGTKEAKSA